MSTSHGQVGTGNVWYGSEPDGGFLEGLLFDSRDAVYPDNFDEPEPEPEEIPL